MMPATDQTILRELNDLKKRLSRLEVYTSAAVYGTWTPAFTGSGTAGVYTYSNQAGDYVKLGNLVFFAGRLTITAIGTPPVGNMTISGLPYTSDGTFERGTVVFGRISQLDLNAADVQMTGFVNSANTNIALETVRDNGAAVVYPAATFTNTATDIIFNGWYAAA